MLRVGIEFPFFDKSWLGGVTAITNLVAAVQELQDPKIEIVIVAGTRTPASLLSRMKGARVFRTSLIDPLHWSNWLGRAARRLLHRNLLLEWWLRRHNIAVYSHGSALGRSASVPTIGHIPDFGYKYFPDLYPEDARQKLDEGTRRICDEYHFLLLSSRAAESDYKKFFPDAAATSVVLNILPLKISARRLGIEQLASKYGIPERYFFCPNQFWVHKNHLAIVEALARAKALGHALEVVCTGLTSDPRRPRHFSSVMDRAKELGVSDRFHVLGLVPYEDAMDLMRDAVAVLSASLFEGWGISVTEAKLLGKRQVLSDIPPFREQAPPNAYFFNPRDADDLARQLIAADLAHNAAGNRSETALHSERWSALLRSHAKDYEAIVLAAAQRGPLNSKSG